MFCENCGTRVEDGQVFCPNCGSKLTVPETPAAPVNPGFEPNPAPAYTPPAAPVKAPQAKGGPFGKLSSMSVMEKILFFCTAGLLVTCVLVSLIRVFYSRYYGGHYAMEAGSVFLSRIITVLFTLSITFLVLDFFDWFNFKFLWFFEAGAAVMIFMIFILIWIISGLRLSIAGWLFLLLVLGLVAVTAVKLILKLTKK